MNSSTIAQLTDRRLLPVLSYAAAGLGHLRVTDALYHGLPETVNPVVLGSQDKSIQTVHRLTSANPVGKAVFDWLQGGPFSSQANTIYRNALRANHREIYDEMCRLLVQRMERPERILVACTHFGLAHKLAAIKDELQRREGVRIVLAVCVTDDTFQHIWYVDGADLLVVPSLHTQRKYVDYGQQIGKAVRVEVVPYPIHPRLADRLEDAQLAGKNPPALGEFCRADPRVHPHLWRGRGHRISLCADVPPEREIGPLTLSRRRQGRSIHAKLPVPIGRQSMDRCAHRQAESRRRE